MEKHFLSRKQEILLLSGTIVASGMAFLDGSVVSVALPSIQNDFHATFSSVLWISNAFLLVLASLLLIAGSLSDRFGRKKVFSAGIVIFTAASLLCALSRSVLHLELSRALQGLGAALMVPNSLALINVNIPGERRGRAIGLWSGFAGGIGAAGPLVGGFLTQHFSWHAIFYINLPLGVAAFVLALLFIPESKNENAKTLDWWGGLLILLGLFGISFSLMSAPDTGWQNFKIWGTFAGGIVALIIFYFVEKKVKAPLVPLEMFRSKLVTGANLVTLLLYFALSGVSFFLTLNMQQVQGLSPTLAGLASLPSVLLITVLSGYGGSISDRIGPRLPMIIGPIVVAAGMVLLFFPGTHANYFTGFLPGLILFGLGMSAVIAPLTNSALSVPGQYSGAASGVNNEVARTAGLLAIAILGAVSAPIFAKALQQNMAQVSLAQNQKQEILSQSNKMADIHMPQDVQGAGADAAKEAVKQSFVRAFRAVAIITALLALLSSAIAFVFIKPKSK